MQGTAPGTNPDILQAIVGGGFFSPEFSEKFFKQEKTPFDQLVEDPDNVYEHILFNKHKKHPFEQGDTFDFIGSSESSKNYKFRHPFDFGEDEYYNRLNFDKTEEKREVVVVKKPEKKIIEEAPSLFKLPKREFKVKEKFAKEQELPNIGEYEISPSIEELKTKTVHELKRVKDVVISNKFGRVQFLEPINLYKKNIEEGIEITQDSIEIIESEWDHRECELTFKNFGNYRNQKKEDCEKLIRKMKKWLSKNQMEEVSFDKTSGDLVVNLIL